MTLVVLFSVGCITSSITSTLSYAVTTAQKVNTLQYSIVTTHRINRITAFPLIVGSNQADGVVCNYAVDPIKIRISLTYEVKPCIQPPLTYTVTTSQNVKVSNNFPLIANHFVQCPELYYVVDPIKIRIACSYVVKPCVQVPLLYTVVSSHKYSISNSFPLIVNGFTTDSIPLNYVICPCIKLTMTYALPYTTCLINSQLTYRVVPSGRPAAVMDYSVLFFTFPSITHTMEYVIFKALYTSDVTSGIVPFTVEFTDQSTGTPTGWSWDFGDGDSSTDQNPSHEYTEDGVYHTQLTITKNPTDTLGSIDIVAHRSYGGNTGYYNVRSTNGINYTVRFYSIAEDLYATLTMGTGGQASLQVLYQMGCTVTPLDRIVCTASGQPTITMYAHAWLGDAERLGFAEQPTAGQTIIINLANETYRRIVIEPMMQYCVIHKGYTVVTTRLDTVGSGTYTVPSYPLDPFYINVEIVGGGGGGGCGGNSNGNYRGHGGYGGNASSKITSRIYPTCGATYTYYIGNGGAGGTQNTYPSFGNNGSNGGTSTFNSVSSSGGVGGARGATYTDWQGEIGGAGANGPGDTGVNGEHGQWIYLGYGYGGEGGIGYGAGGGGGAGGESNNAPHGVPGGAGAKGYVKITAYIPCIYYTLSYAVTYTSTNIIDDVVLQYTVPSTPTPLTTTLVYSIPHASSVTRSLSYTTYTSSNIQSTLAYKITITPIAQTTSLTYYISVPHIVQHTLAYKVTTSVDNTILLRYWIVSVPGTLTHMMMYKVTTHSYVDSSMSYCVKTTDSTTSGLTYYVVVTPTAKTSTLQYYIKTSTTANYVLGYYIIENTACTHTLQYYVSTSTVVQSSLVYTVPTSQSVTKSLAYNVLRVNSTTDTILYYVTSTHSVYVALNYTVCTTDSITSTLSYTVPSTPSAEQYALRYCGISTPAANTASLIYYVSTTVSAHTISIDYAINVAYYQPISLKYYVFFEPAHTVKLMAYRVTTTAGVQHSMEYRVVKTQNAITVPNQYIIKHVYSISKTLTYRIRYTHSALSYTLIYRVPFTAPRKTYVLTYVVAKHKTITPLMRYRVSTTKSIARQLNYVVYSTGKNTVPLTYTTVTHAYVWQTDLTYVVVRSAVCILEYYVTSTTSIQHSLTYTCRGDIPALQTLFTIQGIGKRISMKTTCNKTISITLRISG
jgi:PKD repeat protein